MSLVPTLVIGGHGSFVKSSLEPILRKHGLEIESLWTIDRTAKCRYKHIPKSVEVVVHIIDMSPAAHRFGPAWKEETERLGKKFISTNRKKVFLAKDLEKAGYPEVVDVEETKEEVKAPSWEKFEVPITMEQHVMIESEKKETVEVPVAALKPRGLVFFNEVEGTEEWAEEIAEKLRLNGFTQSAVASVGNIGQSFLSRIIRKDFAPRISVETRDSLAQISTFLEVEMPFLPPCANKFAELADLPEEAKIGPPTTARPVKVPVAMPDPKNFNSAEPSLLDQEPTQQGKDTQEAPADYTRWKFRPPVFPPPAFDFKPVPPPIHPPTQTNVNSLLLDTIFDLVSEKQLTKEGFKRLMEVLR